MNAASVVNDAPVVLDDGSDSLWRPVNSSRDFQGLMRLRLALARSRNLVTIRVLQTMGLDHTIQYRRPVLHLRPAPWPVTGTRQRQPYADGDDQRLRGDRQWWLPSRPWFIERVTRDDDNEIIDEATPVACVNCAEGQETVEIDGKATQWRPACRRRGVHPA